MSTRGCIARLRRKVPLEFEGVYHHWDSYPSGLGRTLFHLRNADFARDTEAMLRVLIDQHPAGWSTVNGATFSKTPSAGNNGSQGEGTDGIPKCYCHGGRNEQSWSVTQRNAAGSGVEYAYAFAGSIMLVIGSYCSDGEKMIGMFGSGDDEAVWRVIVAIDLDGSEPDWEALDGAPPVPNDAKWAALSIMAGVSAQPVSIPEDRPCKKTQPAR